MGKQGERKRQRVSEDRISQLPEDLIHQILSFLPIKSAVQTGILSRHWESFWRSIDRIEFDSNMDARLNLLEHFFARLRQVLTVSTFKLAINVFATNCQPDQLNRFLNFIIEKNPTEIELILRDPFEIPYSVPSGLFQLQNLVVLRLNDVSLVPRAISNLPRLKVLNLFCVRIEDQHLKDILSGCSQIEQIIFAECWGLSDPVFFSSSLKSFEFESFPDGDSDEDFRSITLDAPNLRSSMFRSHDFACTIKLDNRREIRDLSISNLRLDDPWFLENLSIVNCPGFYHLNIQFEHLQEFKFRTAIPMKVSSVQVHTPSLVLFHIEIARNWDGYGTEWYKNLVNDLRMFNGLDTLRISFSSTEDLEIPREVKQNHGAPLSRVNCLQASVQSTEPNARMLLSRFARYAAPSSKKTLTVNKFGIKF